MSNDEALHGNAPDSCSQALLLIDVINDLDFEEGEQLLAHALPMADAIANLKARAEAAGVPVIYANDNFGKWRSNFQEQVRHCCDNDVRGRPIAELLRPKDEDYFVLKAKQSGFHETTLDLLLRHLNAKELIITGMACDICVLFTANDAYMRGYDIVIPPDCVASNTKHSNDQALDLMQRVLKAKLIPSERIRFQEQNAKRVAPAERKATRQESLSH